MPRLIFWCLCVGFITAEAEDAFLMQVVHLTVLQDLIGVDESDEAHSSQFLEHRRLSHDHMIASAAPHLEDIEEYRRKRVVRPVRKPILLL